MALKLSLVGKLTLVIAVMLSFLLGFVIWLEYSSAKTLLLKEARDDLSSVLENLSDRLYRGTQTIGDDAILLSESNDIIGLFRAIKMGGYDDEENMTSNGYKRELEKTFSSIIQSKDYQQIRLINLQTGMEMVRVDGVHGKNKEIHAHVNRELQNKSKEPYVLRGAELVSKELFVSSINLNREHGKIETPWNPTQRYVSAVFEDDQRVGLVVINTRAQSLIDNIVSIDRFTCTLINNEGGIINASDVGLNWGFEFNNYHDADTEMPQAWIALQQDDNVVHWNPEQEVVQAAQRVYLSATQTDEYVGVVVAAKEADIFATVSYLLELSVLTVVIAVPLACLFLALLIRHFVSPIVTLTHQVERIHAGDSDVNIEMKGSDEVGRLGQVFGELIQSLQHQHLESLGLVEKIQSFNANLEHEVERRTEELQISEKKAQEALTVRGQFLASMSHEIRTPMNAVIGMAQLLQDSSLDVEQQDCVTTLQTSAESLLTIINDVLDFSKMDAGKLELDVHPFDVCALMDEVVNILSFKSKERNNECVIQLPENRRVCVDGDKGRLRQVLINLMTNALKFSEKGRVTLRCLILDENDTSIKIRCEVEDNGIGIPESAQSRLFSSFMQVDASTTRQHGGTGLGLAISKQIIELMNGTIGCMSTEGVGSTFFFEVWMPKLTDTEVLEKPGVISGIQESVSMPAEVRILVAEDNLVNQKLIKMMLAKLDYSVEIVENGALAVTAAQESRYDFIFMDWQMPVMDGIQATKAIRAFEMSEHGSQNHAIIIAMTANAMSGDRETCLDAGMDDYIAKPIRKDGLQGIINKWI